jgi:hypothetical protein
MGRFVEGADRRHDVVLLGYLDDELSKENAVRVIDGFVGELDLRARCSRRTAATFAGSQSGAVHKT